MTKVNLLDFTLSKPADSCWWWVVILGQPRSKQRYKASRRRSWNPSREDEDALAWQVRTIYTAPQPDRDHLWGVRCIFYCQNLQRGRMDGDNLQKLVLDSLQGVVWKNDFMVRELYSLTIPVTENPRTEILFYHLPTEVRDAHAFESKIRI